MFNISTVKPGQRVTVCYASPVTWGRKTDNPFVDMDVQREMTVAFTAAGHETYHNMAEKHGHETSGRQPWFDWTPTIGPCVVSHRTKGTVYLAGVNHDTVSAQFLIGGKLATAEESEQIRSFLRASEERERGLDFRVWTVDKLTNATIT